MEKGCLSLTTSSPSSRPSIFFNNNGVFQSKQFKPSHHSSIPTISESTQITRRRRKPLSIKASNNDNFEASIRQTLASNWDVFNYSAPPTRLPRLDELDTANMLQRQRIIFLGSQVDDASADYVISQLLFLDAEDGEKDIKLFINSPGGSITAGMGIYDAMKLCKADVSTICMGFAASMGAFILAAGTKGKRYCMPNARVMIHQPYGQLGGSLTEMYIRTRELMYHMVKMKKIFSRITGKPEHQIEMDTDRDNFMNAWEAKEYGLVDVVIDDGKPGLVAPIADASPPPRPRLSKLLRIDGRKSGHTNIPSEERLLQQGSDEGRGMETDSRAPHPG
ncbi:hypothetical protein LguiA_014158 [Lonicera macranthoides]